MDTAELVRDLARKSGRLAEDERGLHLDSTGVIEFTMALEDAGGIEIPNTELTIENFATVDAVARLIDRLRRPAD